MERSLEKILCACVCEGGGGGGGGLKLVFTRAELIFNSNAVPNYKYKYICLVRIDVLYLFCETSQ